MNDIPKVNLSQMIPTGFSLDWFRQNWIISIILLILCILLIFFVVVPLIAKLFAKKKKASDTASLQKDLMIWKKLSELVRGGDRGLEAKESLSTKLSRIKTLFSAGLKLFHDTRRGKYDVPWILVTGEPGSGKSTLLKNSDLNLRCSGKLGTDVIPGNGGDSAPIACWLGSKLYLLEVSGRIFFDRWLDGSSAEWHYIARLLGKYHHRRPLSGILLVIPVDALISDDEALTRQKATLIASELYHFLSRIGMKLPCHVVITKSDMLPGFREYFSSCSEKERFDIFGWQNADSTGYFHEEVFSEKWDTLVEKLRNGVITQFKKAEYFRQSANESDRMMHSGQVMIFPEHFHSIKKNLMIYLNQIFGSDSWQDIHQALLSGVFFTSAEDNGIILAPEYAALLRKNVEDAPIQTKPAQERVSFFIHNLLLHIASPAQQTGNFVTHEVFMRALPKLIFSSLCLFLGCLWIFYAEFGTGKLHTELDQPTVFYRDISRRFASNKIAESPFFTADSTGKVSMENDRFMAGDKRNTRLRYYFDMNNFTKESIDIPFGFKTSGFLQFGTDVDIASKQREALFNQLQAQMVVQPAIHAFQSHILAKPDEPLNATKIEAYKTYISILFAPSHNFKKELPISTIIQYICPEIELDTVKLYSKYYKHSEVYFAESLSSILFDYTYSEAFRIIWEDFFTQWKNLTIYPEEPFHQFRTIYREADSFASTIQDEKQLLQTMPEQESQYGTPLVIWHELLKKQLASGKIISDSLDNLAASGFRFYVVSPLKEADQKDDPKKSVTTRRNMSDMLDESIEKYVAIFENLKKRTSVLQQEYSTMDETMQLLETLFEKMTTLENDCQIISQRLEEESRDLHQKSDFLESVHFFDYLTAQTEKQEEQTAEDFQKQQFCRVLYQLIQIADSTELQKPDFNRADCRELWTLQQETTKSVNQQIDDIAKLYPEVPQLADFVAQLKKFINLQYRYNCYVIANEMLKQLPATETELNEKFSSTVSHVKLFEVPDKIIEDILGKFAVSAIYNPETAVRYFNEFSFLKKIFTPTEEKGTIVFSASDFPRYSVVEHVMHNYIDSYLEYWGKYGDSLQFTHTSWKDFRDDSLKIKPYAVNQFLLSVYGTSSNTLLDIPQSILTEKQVQTLNAAVAKLTLRKQILTTVFSELCIKQNAAWATLPADAFRAFTIISALPTKQLLTDYFAVIATGDTADIPWWSKFFLQGATLLKTEASVSFFNSVEKYRDSIFRFPICADAVDPRAFTMEEITELQHQLSSLQLDYSNKPAADETEKQENLLPVDMHSLDLLQGLTKDEDAWLKNFNLIFDAIGNNVKPLVWTMGMPGGTLATQLKETYFPDTPSASVRYRYVEICSGNRIILPKKQINSLQGQNLVRGDIASHELTFNFYDYSDAEKPAAVINLSGTWSIFKLYLNQNGYFDPASKLLYVPLILHDSMNMESMLYLTLSFNKSLPTPSEWPSTRNWPHGSAFFSKREADRTIKMADWKKLLLSEQADYTELTKALIDYDVDTYPDLDITLGPADDAFTQFLARNRYVELHVPGIPSTRRSAVPGLYLGHVPLNNPKFEIRFYRFTTDDLPSVVISVNGPYAPIRLLSTSGRKRIETGIQLRIPCENSETSIPLDCNLQQNASLSVLTGFPTAADEQKPQEEPPAKK